MSEIGGETTMEDILASIKKIIADDGSVAPSPRPFRKEIQADFPPRRSAPRHEDVLDLTDAANEDAFDTQEPAILSSEAAAASRHALDALNSAVTTPPPPAPAPAQGVTVEHLASELLRPMLKEWLDAHLPEIVERLVAKEVARISGRSA